MRKLNLRLANFEYFDRAFSRWIDRRKFRFVIVGVFSAIIFLLKGLPYFNLVFDTNTFLLTISFFAIFVLDISEQLVFIFALVLFVVVVPFLMLGAWQQAEVFGNFIYGLFLTGVLKEILFGRVKK